MKRKICLTLAIAVAVFLSFRLYYALTDDFRLSNITYPMPYNEAWSIKTSDALKEDQLEKILGQTYTYMGKGAQSYAFGSADGKYVLKLFKFKHLRPSIFLDFLPSVGPLKTYKEKENARKRRKLLSVFNGYKLAFDINKEGSGILFIQLNNTDNPERHVTLLNKLGLEYVYNLQNIPFIIQKKGKTLRQVMHELLSQNQVELAEDHLGQILDHYANEYSRSIFDHDHGVMRNMGFADGEPFHLDVGKLNFEPQMQDKSIAKQDALIIANKMKRWIKNNYPNYFERMSAYIDHKVNMLYE